MNPHKTIFKELLPIIVGQAVCVAAMTGIFALLGYFDSSVLLGGILGALVASVNFLVLTLCVDRASKKAEAQDVAGGQKLLQLSYMGRMIGSLAVLILLAKTGHCHPVCLVLPLAFNRPILTVFEWIRKKGGAVNEHER